MSGARLNVSAGALAALYFFSGATSLAYEVLWARMLSLQFGVSTFGIVVTVGAFMLGLGAGSLYGASTRMRGARPLLVYGILEIVVGLFAAIAPLAAQQLSGAITTYAADANVATWHAAHAVADLLLMVMPSFAMGVAFPMILRAAPEGTLSISRIYGLNAIGGAVGALAPLLLLPAIGWVATTQLFAGTGIAVGVAALLLARSAVTPPQAMTAASVLTPSVIGLYAAVGAGALMLEIGWSRLYGMILLRTEYVLAVIVAVFLAGIGLGSILARRLTHPWWVRVLPVVVAISAIATLALIATISAAVESATYTSLASAIATHAVILAVLTLPATLAFGAWLPLLAARYEHGSHAGATLYGANSIGAAIGTLVAGFVLIPAVGTAATVALAAALVVAAGFALAHARAIQIALATGIALLAALPFVHLPAAHQLLPRALADSNDIYTHEDAVTMTHVIERADGQRLLLDDLQRMDASSDPDAVVLQQNQVRLALMLNPQAQTMLLLGLGTGISASAAAEFPELQVTAAELSCGAIEAARDYFAPVNHDIAKRIRIERDDARRVLARQQVWDVIVGDLFHPDLAGRSALLSVEQFQRARDRLGSNGVFVQWIALNQFDVPSLEIVLRSFATAFPNGVLYIDPFRVALVGGAGTLPPVIADAAEPHAGDEGIDTWRGRYLGRIAAHIDSNGPVQSEIAPRIEYLLPKARYRGELDVATLLQKLLKRRPVWDAAAIELGIAEAKRESFEQAYGATELALAGWIATLKGRSDDGALLLQKAFQANARDRWIGIALVTPAWEQYRRLQRENRPVREAFGKDERDVLDAMLRIRPDFWPALHAKMQLEQAAGNTLVASELRARLRVLSPLARLD